MTRFGPSNEPITLPMPRRYATCYATDVGYTYKLGYHVKKAIDRIKGIGRDIERNWTSAIFKIFEIFFYFTENFYIYVLKIRGRGMFSFFFNSSPSGELKPNLFHNKRGKKNFIN